MAVQEGRFITISKTALGVVNSLVNVAHDDPNARQSIQNLLKLMYYLDRPVSEDPRELPNVDLTFVREHILNKRITLVPKIPNPQDHDKCVIVITFDNFEISDNKEYNVHKMAIDVLAPTETWLTGTIYGSVPRIFLMMEEIERLINGKYFDGLGVVELQRAKSLALTPDLIGYSMIFGTMDFE